MPTLRIAVWQMGATLLKPVQNANHRWSSRRGLVCRISTSTGQHGFGEASPLPNYSPETIESAQQFLKTFELFEEKELGLEAIEECIAQIPNSLPSARFAIETALLDMLAFRQGQSISALVGTKTQRISRCGLLDPDAPIQSATALQKRGIHCAKLKVGRNWEMELATIQRLCQSKPGLRLRLDVNAAWSKEQAIQRLATLAELPIEFVEQPVLPEEMSHLADSPTPIAADESMHSAAGISGLSESLIRGALVAIVLKPTVLGGFLACNSHASWAEERGLQTVSSHCFEGPIATAALAEVALILSSPRPAGIDSHSALSVWPDVDIPQLRHPEIEPHSPGLGVCLSP